MNEVQGLLLEVLKDMYMPDDPVNECLQVVKDSILHLEVGDDGEWPFLEQGLTSF